jgi:ParB-like chromosome segregation protein Spo0J
MKKTTTPTPARKAEKRVSASLTLHHKHLELMEPTDAEIDLLSRDIKKRKLQHLIEITPGGVIIAGRKRWFAMQRLHIDEYPCLVRYDLASRGEVAIVEHLVLDNLARRQHSDL